MAEFPSNPNKWDLHIEDNQGMRHMAPLVYTFDGTRWTAGYDAVLYALARRLKAEEPDA